MTDAQRLALEDGLGHPDRAIRGRFDQQTLAALQRKGWITPMGVVTDVGEGVLKGTVRESSQAIQARGQSVGVEIQAQAAATDVVVMDSYEVLVQVGRIEGMTFAAHVLDVAIAQTFDQIRKSNKYKGLPYKDKNGNAAHVQDLEGFCQVFLGKSYTRCRCLRLAQNLNLLGPELYEQAERIGLKSRDYAALKALPESDQQIIKDAVAAGDRDQVVEIMKELVVKHDQEKKAAEGKIQQVTADAGAAKSRLEAVNKELSDARLELTKLQKYTPAQVKDNMDGQMMQALDQAKLVLTSQMARLSTVVGDYLDLGMTEHREDAVVGVMLYLAQEFHEVLYNHGIRLDFQDILNPQATREQEVPGSYIAGGPGFQAARARMEAEAGK